MKAIGGVLLSKDGVLRIGNYVIQNMFRLGASAPPEMYDRENYKVLGTIGRGIFVMRKKQEPTTKQLVKEIQKASSYKAVAPEEMSSVGYSATTRRKYTLEELKKIARKRGVDLVIYGGRISAGNYLFPPKDKNDIAKVSRKLTEMLAKHAENSGSGIARAYIISKEGEVYIIGVDSNLYVRGLYLVREKAK